MKYVSTRGNSPMISFGEVIFKGTAEDGGLYVPQNYPDLSSELDKLAKLNYQDLAVAILRHFVGETLTDDELTEVVYNTYQRFDHENVAVLEEYSDTFILELFHGPTRAFKDYALSLLGEIYELVLEKNDEYLNLIGATSGDTGSAAIYAVMDKARINAFIFHPDNRISRVQKLQMTTVRSPNIFNIAISGSFDDAQRVVKEIFSDSKYCEKLRVGSVNSINWLRILAQTIYYFYAGLKFKDEYPEKPLVFSVPTGNFGNLFSGFLAKKMGLPVHSFIGSLNSNDVLLGATSSGKYSPGEVHQSLAPSMDIQNASNFERLLYEISEQNGSLISKYYAELKENGNFHIQDDLIAKINSLFTFVSCSDDEILKTIQDFHGKNNTILDPHTATSIFAAKKLGFSKPICLSTAHPSKFMDTIKSQLDIDCEIPKDISELFNKDMQYRKIPPNTDQIKEFIQNSVGN